MNNFLIALFLLSYSPIVYGLNSCNSIISSVDSVMHDTGFVLQKLSNTFNRVFSLADEKSIRDKGALWNKDNLLIKFQIFNFIGEIVVSADEKRTFKIKKSDLFYLTLAKDYRDSIFSEDKIGQMIKKTGYFKRIKVLKNNMGYYDIECFDKRYKKKFSAIFHVQMMHYHKGYIWYPGFFMHDKNELVSIDFIASKQELSKFKLRFVMATHSPDPTKIGISEIFVFDIITHKLTEQFAICRPLLRSS